MPVLGWLVELVFPVKFNSVDKIGAYTGCVARAPATSLPPAEVTTCLRAMALLSSSQMLV